MSVDKIARQDPRLLSARTPVRQPPASLACELSFHRPAALNPNRFRSRSNDATQTTPYRELGAINLIVGEN